MAGNPRPRRQRPRKSAGSPADSASHAAQPTPLKPWTFLLYLCGDNPDLEGYVQAIVGELQAWTKPLERVHIVVQADTLNDGAQRFLVGETNNVVDEAGDGRRKNRPPASGVIAPGSEARGRGLPRFRAGARRGRGTYANAAAPKSAKTVPDLFFGDKDRGKGCRFTPQQALDIGPKICEAARR